MGEENQDCTNELLSSESLRKSPELVRKSPIFNYFKVLESDKRRAECDLCGQNFSLGSEKPKFQSTSTIKNHLRTKHQDEYSKFLQEFNESKDKKPIKGFKTIKKSVLSSNKKPNHDSISYQQNVQGELTSYQQNMEELAENDTEAWENPINFSENSIKISDNPWQVESIDSFYYLKCPECGFDTKDEDFFELHATENHPLSFTFYGQTYNVCKVLSQRSTKKLRASVHICIVLSRIEVKRSESFDKKARKRLSSFTFSCWMKLFGDKLLFNVVVLLEKDV